MQNLNKTLEKAYKLFVPSLKDISILDNIAKQFLGILEEKALNKKIQVDFKFSGSYAKGTWLKGESDLDILAVFQKEADIKYLEDIIPENFIETFGTRKYFRGFFKGIEIELVPVVKFSNIKAVINSIDLSILHADYINSRLSEKQKKDVILLKALCKANNCYGSETYIHGFSGYALEVMISKFGDIKNLIEEAQNWYVGVSFGDKNTKEEYAIYLPDPTNIARNICASVNTENLGKFILALKLLKIEPSINLFKKIKVTDLIKEQKKFRGTKLFKFVTKIKEPRDVFLSKYVKNCRKLIEELKKNDVSIYSIDFDYSRREAKMFLQISNFPRTKTRIFYGPSVFSSIEIIKAFIKSHKDIFIDKNKLAYDKRYNIKDFNKFILLKIKEYMSQNAILKD